MIMVLSESIKYNLLRGSNQNQKLVNVCVRRPLHFDIFSAYKMNVRTSSIEEYVNFVDLTKKQNKYLKYL